MSVMRTKHYLHCDIVPSKKGSFRTVKPICLFMCLELVKIECLSSHETIFMPAQHLLKKKKEKVESRH